MGMRWHVTVLICISHIFSDVEHLLVLLLAIHICSLGKCLLKSSAHFWIRLFIILLLIFKSSLYIQYIDPSDTWLADIFSHSVSCFLTLLIVFFGCFFFFFPFGLMACGISIPWPGIEPRPQQWKCQILTPRQGTPLIYLIHAFLMVLLRTLGEVGSLFLWCICRHH